MVKESENHTIALVTSSINVLLYKVAPHVHPFSHYLLDLSVPHIVD